MSRTRANRPAFAAIACVALAATLAGSGALAAAVDSAAVAAATIQCADPATPPPSSAEATAPRDPIDGAPNPRPDARSALDTGPPTPSGDGLPWGPLILGAVALQVLVSVAWTIVRHSRDG